MNWIKVCGQNDLDFELQVAEATQLRIEAKKFSQQDVKNISDVESELIKKDLKVSSTELERVRELCRLWDISLNPIHITSHRKFLGPVIVAIKKLIFPLVRIFMKETLNQQRQFNAAVVSMIAEILNSKQDSSGARNMKFVD